MRLNAAEALKTNDQVTESLENAEMAEAIEATKNEVRELKQDIAEEHKKILTKEQRKEENETIQEIKEKTTELKKTIEQQKPRPVETLPSGTIRIPYDRKNAKRNFDINPTTQKITIRQYTHIPALKKHGRKRKNTLPIDLGSKSAFFASLGKVLDQSVGTKREKIPQKATKARSLIAKPTTSVEVKRYGLKKKPIDLGYKNILPDQSISFYEKLPDRNSPAGRILRCMRYKTITDAAEKRYGIPEGLLLAMMAQEGYGDPTIPNFLQDGGVGLIHIQARNASDYGLKTLKRYSKGMVDKRHGKLVNAYLKKYNSDPKHLQKFDDRFHPVMAIDVAARFLVDRKNRLKRTVGETEQANIWLYALKRYGPGNPPAPQGFKKYANKVANYRQLLQKSGFINNPRFITTMKPAQRRTIEARYREKKLHFAQSEQTIKQYKRKRRIARIGGKDVNYRGYIQYFDNLHNKNYEGEKYKKLGKK